MYVCKLMHAHILSSGRKVAAVERRQRRAALLVHSLPSSGDAHAPTQVRIPTFTVARRRKWLVLRTRCCDAHTLLRSASCTSSHVALTSTGISSGHPTPYLCAGSCVVSGPSTTRWLTWPCPTFLCWSSSSLPTGCLATVFCQDLP